MSLEHQEKWKRQVFWMLSLLFILLRNSAKPQKANDLVSINVPIMDLANALVLTRSKSETSKGEYWPKWMWMTVDTLFDRLATHLKLKLLDQFGQIHPLLFLINYRTTQLSSIYWSRVSRQRHMEEQSSQDTKIIPLNIFDKSNYNSSLSSLETG